jgi:hypothetical protein
MCPLFTVSFTVQRHLLCATCPQSWDVMEPIGYMLSLTYSLLAYFYFLVTRGNYFDYGPFEEYWTQQQLVRRCVHINRQCALLASAVCCCTPCCLLLLSTTMFSGVARPHQLNISTHVLPLPVRIPLLRAAICCSLLQEKRMAEKGFDLDRYQHLMRTRDRYRRYLAAQEEAAGTDDGAAAGGVFLGFKPKTS